MKSRGKKRRYIAPLVLLTLVLLGLLAYYQLFVIRNVQVDGTSGLSAEEIIRLSKINLGGSIFSLDRAAIQRSIEDSGTVAVDGIEPRYPDTVILKVHGRTREAMLLHAGRMLVLDENACAIELSGDVQDTDLVYLSGFTISGYRIGMQVTADAEKIAGYIAVIQALDSNAADSCVSELDLSDPAQLKIITRTGIIVRLGDAENMSDKIAWMKSAVTDLESRGQAGGTLDVSSGTKADYSLSASGSD